MCLMFCDAAVRSDHLSQGRGRRAAAGEGCHAEFHSNMAPLTLSLSPGRGNAKHEIMELVAAADAEGRYGRQFDLRAGGSVGSVVSPSSGAEEPGME